MRCSDLYSAQPLEPRTLLAIVPDGFVDAEVIGGLDSPTAMVVAPDGRIFLAEQKGTVWIVQNGQKSLFATLPQVDYQVERGLLGITLDPNFASNKLVYVYYTTTAGGYLHNRISRIPDDGNTAGAEQVLLNLPDIGGTTNHLGGALHFGTDGMLYVGSGDHTQGQVAQQLDNIFGKILRFNSNGTIPTDNPFYSQTTGVNRAIYAIGFRNPFTFAVQPGTGRIYVNDVGAETWEEIDHLGAGQNYGWPTSEGPDNTAGFTAPLYAFPHGQRDAIAIAGGAFYDPATPTFPSQYQGKYFFADLGGWWVDMYDPQTGDVENVINGIPLPVDLDVADDGSLYYLARGMDFGQGLIGRVQYAAAGAPNVSQQPQSQTVAAGSEVSFTVAASGAGSLNYQWQRNGDDIDGATNPAYTIDAAAPGDAGQYRVVVSNEIGTATSSSATLVVTDPSGSLPVPTILTPAAGTRFRYGQSFNFSGSATDAEDGALSAASLKWRVDYHTGDVIRPFVPESAGISSGSFTIPDETPFKEPNVLYRITLTATDSNGQSATVTRDLIPQTARLAVKSSIAGVTLLLDGIPRSSGFTHTNVAGMKRVLEAPASVSTSAGTFAFDGWSDGGERVHTISAPAADTTYLARYRPVSALSTKGISQTIYNNRDRTGTVTTRTATSLDFDWGAGSPDPLIARDTFFIRWRGKVQPLFSETYTFYADADDAVRLFVNGQLLVDTWDGGSAAVEQSGSIDLVAGQKYDLRFDYYENLGDAHARLFWSSASQERQIIPRNRLYSQIMPRTLIPTADAYVQGGLSAGDNFGLDELLSTRTSSNSSLNRETYLKFDISALSANISSAKIRLFGQLGSTGETNLVTALYSAPKAKWSETGIRWQNKPAAATKALATATVSNTTAQWYEFDITGFLQLEKAAGRTIVTFVLKNLTSGSVETLWNSRNNSTNVPQLQVW